MFAVNGWKITAPLATQVDPESLSAKPRTNPAVGESKEIAGATDKPLKKRKRGKGPQVTEKNVGELYHLYIEGGQPRKNKHTLPDLTAKPQRGLDALENGPADGELIRRSEKKTRRSKDEPQVGNAIATGFDQSIKAQNGQPMHSPSAGASKDKGNAKSRNQKRRNDAIAESKDGSDAIKIQGPAKFSSAAHDPPPRPALTPLQSSMAIKLASARFRHLNETLYTKPSVESMALFTDDPSLFHDYHVGFRQQVDVWPENPVDGYIKDIKGRGKVKGAVDKAKYGNVKALPRSRGVCRIADLGCGDANLSRSLQPSLPSLKLDIHSFDLQSDDPLVTKADIAHVPLDHDSTDVAIFCLALMGTNWPDFIAEAWRILRPKGELWVAEIKSRFSRLDAAGRLGNKPGHVQKVVEHSVGKRRRLEQAQGNAKGLHDDDAEDSMLSNLVDEEASGSRQTDTDIGGFLTVLKRHGFVLDGPDDGAVDLKNKMFVKMRFIKISKAVVEHGPAWKADGRAKDGEKLKGRKYSRSTTGEQLDKNMDPTDEFKVLKPCVYKLR